MSYACLTNTLLKYYECTNVGGNINNTKMHNMNRNCSGQQNTQNIAYYLDERKVVIPWRDLHDSVSNLFSQKLITITIRRWDSPEGPVEDCWRLVMSLYNKAVHFTTSYVSEEEPVALMLQFKGILIRDCYGVPCKKCIQYTQDTKTLKESFLLINSKVKYSVWDEDGFYHASSFHRRTLSVQYVI